MITITLKFTDDGECVETELSRVDENPTIQEAYRAGVFFYNIRSTQRNCDLLEIELPPTTEDSE